MWKSRILIMIPLILFAACKPDPKLFLTIEKELVRFESSDAATAGVAIDTNVPEITISMPAGDGEWCSVTLDQNILNISVTANPGGERTTTLTISADGVTPVTITVEQSKLKSSEKSITSFVIPAAANGLTEDIEGIIDLGGHTITITTDHFIPNLKSLVPQFEAVGRVLANGTEQESGVTAVSFAGELIYRVEAEDGTTVDYEVKGEGPMFTGLPVISIDIDDGLEVVQKTLKLPSTLNMVVPGNESFDMNEEHMTIRGRGNTTWGMPKKPYRIDFPSKTSMFGLPAAKKWVLLANYQDPTLLMNDIAFELGRRFGLQYTHSSIHVDLFINGTYRGNYQLTEQKEIGEGRVEVDKKKGFLVELDSYYDEEFKFRSTHLNLPVMVADADVSSEAEMQYIVDAFQGLEDALFEPGFPNNSYENHTDAASLINFMLVNEIVENGELYHPKSTYCYKDEDTRIMWGPLWDFDYAFAYWFNGSYFRNHHLLFYPGNTRTNAGSQFFCRFMEIPGFREMYVDRWQQMKPQVADIINYIDAMEQKLDKSQKLNFQIAAATPPGKNASYHELLGRMKQWLTDRIIFLDDKFSEF